MKKAIYAALLLIIAVALTACSGKRDEVLRRLQKRRNGIFYLLKQLQNVSHCIAIASKTMYNSSEVIYYG